MRTWMRHLFFRERLMQASNEQRKLAAEFLGTAGVRAPAALHAVAKDIDRVVKDLRDGFEERDPKILCVLLPAAPTELPKPAIPPKA